MDLPSRAEMFARAKAAVLAVSGSRISPKEIDRDGSDANLLVAAISLMGEEVVTRLAQQLAGVFEDTATGSQLDRVIFDRKGLPRLPASPSVGVVQLSRPTFAAGAGSIYGALPGADPPPTRIGNQAGIVFLLLQPVDFGAADLGPFEVQIQSQLAGLAYEVDANQTWQFLDPVFDGSIVISNSVETAGAADQETDDAYRTRAKAFFPTLRRGTLPAIDFGLRSTPGVESDFVAEILNPANGLPGGAVQGYVLDALGQSNSTLAANALLNLIDYRAAGIPVIITPGTPFFVTIRIILAFDVAVVNDTIAATTAVKNAIVAALDNQRPGQTLFRSTIIAAARSVAGVDISDSALVTPAGDLDPPDNATKLTTRSELITTT